MALKQQTKQIELIKSLEEDLDIEILKLVKKLEQARQCKKDFTLSRMRLEAKTIHGRHLFLI